jgi:hypothetical protein
MLGLTPQYGNATVIALAVNIVSSLMRPDQVIGRRHRLPKPSFPGRRAVFQTRVVAEEALRLYPVTRLSLSFLRFCHGNARNGVTLRSGSSAAPARLSIAAPRIGGHHPTPALTVPRA